MEGERGKTKKLWHYEKSTVSLTSESLSHKVIVNSRVLNPKNWNFES